MSKKIRYTILFILLILIGGYLAFRIKKLSNSMTSFNGIVNSIPLDYIALFDSTSQKKLLASYTQMSKVRNPNSILKYDLRYTLVICKINLATSLPLNNFLHRENGTARRSEDALYMEALAAPIKIDINTDSIANISSVFFKTAGDSTAPFISNDSVYSCYVRANNFSIKYGTSSPVDILAFNDKVVPADIVFLIRNKSLYFILMAPDDKSTSIAPDLLYSLIRK